MVVLKVVPSPFNQSIHIYEYTCNQQIYKYRDRVCKTIEKTGIYPTILKCPELGPDIDLTEQEQVVVVECPWANRRARFRFAVRQTHALCLTDGFSIPLRR